MGKILPRLRNTPPLNVVLRKIAYLDGFICQCGGTEFAKKENKIVGGRSHWSHYHYCLKCGESYLLVKHISFGGTSL